MAWYGRGISVWRSMLRFPWACTAVHFCHATGLGQQELVFYFQETGWAHVLPTVALLLAESTYLGQFVECSSLYIDGISRHLDSLFWHETQKHD